MNYDGIHKWLNYHYPKTCVCDHCNRGEAKKYEYALIHGKEHGQNRSNYLELCAGCHRKYDGAMERLARSKHKPVAAYKGAQLVGVYSSCKTAAECLSVSRTAMSNMLNGRAKTAGGYNFEFHGV